MITFNSLGGIFMKYYSALFLTLTMIFLSGCQLSNESPSAQPKDEQKELKPADMDDEDLPDMGAFQDEFTRGFLQSTEETRTGYYPFLSGTGAYKMDFPAEGDIVEEFYNIKDKSFEAIMISDGNEKANINHIITIEYYDHLTEVHKDSRIGQLLSQIGEDAQLTEVEKNHQTFYIAPYKSKEEASNLDIYGYGTFVLNNDGQGGVEIILTSYCENNCAELKESDDQKMYDWIMSLEFTKSSMERDQSEK